MSRKEILGAIGGTAVAVGTVFAIAWLASGRSGYQRSYKEEVHYDTEDVLALTEGKPTPENIDELVDQVSIYRGTRGSWPLSNEDVGHLVRHLREEHPFVDYKDALAYETTAVRPPQKLSTQSREELYSQDNQSDYFRTASLERLHSHEAAAFVARTGEGFKRSQPVTVEYLEIEEYTRIPFEGGGLASAGEPVSLPSEEPTYNEFPRSTGHEYARWFNARNLLRLPSKPRLTDLHQNSRYQFAVKRSGFVQDGKVAGFDPHAIRKPLSVDLGLARQTPDYWKDEERIAVKNRWQVSSMLLVSLLRHDKPLTYVSHHLPSMDELETAPTRELNKFEANSLPHLYEGEDIVTDAHLNRIRMLGSLRASKNCLECHGVERGDLLGAFSYELVRATPLSEDSKALMTSR